MPIRDLAIRTDSATTGRGTGMSLGKFDICFVVLSCVCQASAERLPKPVDGSKIEQLTSIVIDPSIIVGSLIFVGVAIKVS